MLRSLGGGQIKKKKHKNNGGQSQSFKNNNNKINEKGAIWGANENFRAHSTEAKSLRATISNICAKIIKI